MATIQVTYRKSAIGYASDQKRTIAALGLKKLNHTVALPDTDAVRGMVDKVRHLVSVDGVPADAPIAPAQSRATRAKDKATS